MLVRIKVQLYLETKSIKTIVDEIHEKIQEALVQIAKSNSLEYGAIFWLLHTRFASVKYHFDVDDFLKRQQQKYEYIVLFHFKIEFSLRISIIISLKKKFYLLLDSQVCLWLFLLRCRLNCPQVLANTDRCQFDSMQTRSKIEH